MDRHAKQEIHNKLNGNKYLKLLNMNKDNVDNEEDLMPRNVFEPYQQKVEYEIYSDSSDILDPDESPISPDDDDKCAEEQPYYTATHIRYKKDVE